MRRRIAMSGERRLHAVPLAMETSATPRPRAVVVALIEADT